jgi:hypothetical protein
MPVSQAWFDFARFEHVMPAFFPLVTAASQSAHTASTVEVHTAVFTCAIFAAVLVVAVAAVHALQEPVLGALPAPSDTYVQKFVLHDPVAKQSAAVPPFVQWHLEFPTV